MMTINAAWKMKEDTGPNSLAANLRRLMSDYHLYGFHARSAIGSEAGWPDWVIIGPNGILFRELKSQRGELTPEQRSVGSKLAKVGLDWAVWRPQHLFDGTIERRLAAIAMHKQESLV
jgi:hypothetical protein